MNRCAWAGTRKHIVRNKQAACTLTCSNVPAGHDDHVVPQLACGCAAHGDGAAVAAGRAAVVDEVRDVAGARGVNTVVRIQPEDVRAWQQAAAEAAQQWDAASAAAAVHSSTCG